MNHLFVGKTNRTSSSGRNRVVTEGPRISQQFPPSHTSANLSKQLQAVANAQAVSKSQRMRSGRLKGDNEHHKSKPPPPMKTEVTNCPPQTTVSSLEPPPQSTMNPCPQGESNPPPENDNLSSSLEDCHSSSNETAVPLSVSVEKGEHSSECETQVPSTAVLLDQQKDNSSMDSAIDADTGTISDKCVQTSFEFTDTLDNNLIQLNENRDGKDLHSICSSHVHQSRSPSVSLDSSHLTQPPSSLICTSSGSINTSTILSCVTDDSQVKVPYSSMNPSLSPSRNTAIECVVSSSSSTDEIRSSSKSDPANSYIEAQIDETVITSNSLSPHNLDSLPDDSGIESSSTASPSSTPRRTQELEPKTDSEGEDFLSVQTSLSDQGKLCTISQTNYSVGLESRSNQSDAGDGLVIQQQNKIAENCTANIVSGSVSHDDSISKKVNQERYSSANDINITESNTVNADKLEEQISLSLSNSKDNIPESPKLLNIAMLTSPQKKFIYRSMSCNNDSYVSSPGVIETVPVPENFEVSSNDNRMAHIISNHHNHHQQHHSTKQHTPSLAKRHGGSFSSSTMSEDQAQSEVRERKNSLKNENISTPNIPSSHIKSSFSERENKAQSCEGTNFTSSNAVNNNMDKNSRRYSTPAASVLHSLKNPTQSKPFNPFPVKLFNANRAKTGLKLGLYTTSTLEQLKGMKSRTTST